MIGPVARVISQEVGVLTDRDIKRAEGMLPAMTDGPETRRKKLQIMKEALSNISPEELGARLSGEVELQVSDQYKDLNYEI